MYSRGGMDRRAFIRRTGAATAGAMALRSGGKTLWASEPGSAAIGPGDRVRAGIIGPGMRGLGDAGSFLAVPGTELVMAADVYDDRLTRAKELFGGQLETTKDYRRVLDRKDIDAVIVTTHDPWHKRIIIEAMESGKDVYCEKPMTHRIEEGFEIIDAEKRYQKILYVGSQWVSSPLVQLAKKWVDEGRLGQITLVKSWENRNSTTGACYYPVAPDASEENLDWKTWLGPSPQVQFDARRYFRWRVYWDYSGGMATDLGVHYLNTLHYLLNVKAPKSAICYGGSYRWKKVYPETEIPVVIQALYEYPDFTFNLSITLNTQTQEIGTLFMGTKGAILLDESKMTFYPEDNLEGYGWIVNAWPEAKQKQFVKENNLVGLDQSWTPGTCRAPERYEHYDVVGEPTDLHMKNFVESVRTRKASMEGAVAAHNAVVGGHIANLSYQNGSRKVTWDGRQATVV